jgi:Methylamine utilisation protein MauE
VLLGAGVPKVRASSTFAEQVTDYGILSRGVSRIAAVLISWLEVVAGGALILGLLLPAPIRQIGAGLAIVLFATFLAALMSARARGANIACACFGGNSDLEKVGAHSLVRTGLLLALAVVALSPSSGAQPLVVLGLAAILGALVALCSELVRLMGELRVATRDVIQELEAVARSRSGAEVAP